MRKFKLGSRSRLCLCTVAASVAAVFIYSPVRSLEGKTASTHHSHRNPHMKEGILLYKRGNFRDSMTEFAQALNSEFDNATLHYYMANSLVGMRQREAAIREFRIAYALAPKEEAGMLAHLALSYMGADNYDDNVTKRAEPKKDAKQEPKIDPVFEKSLEVLRKQAADAAFDVKNLSPKEVEMVRVQDENITKSRNAVVDALLRANPEDLHLTSEAMNHLNQTKRLIEEKNRRMGNVIKKSSGVTDTADSLKTLMMEKNSKSAPKLDPRGTNLYIRNYSAPSSKSPKASGATKPSSSESTSVKKSVP